MWNLMFDPSRHIWPSYKVNNYNVPNDMISWGHYSHMAEGRPYPCWGYGLDHAAGSCDDTIDYGWTVVLDALAAAGFVAPFKPGTLTIDSSGKAAIPEGVVDNNWENDPIGVYNMQGGEKGKKRLKFIQGVPHFQLLDLSWIRMFAYVCEDALEVCCAKYHLPRVANRESCTCVTFCCEVCNPS
jgi:hypothetical protein